MLDKNRIGKELPHISEDDKIREYLDETLEVEQYRIKKHQGKKLSVIEERKIKNNNDKKVRVLDNYIFRSMANLIYFFRFMIRHPHLMDRFGEDIEELLGLKEDVGDVKFRSWGLEALINLILNYPSHPSDPYDKYLDDARFNFKRHLLPILQESIHSHVTTIMTHSRRDMLFKVMVDDDFQRAVTWTKNVDKEPRNMRKPIARKIIVYDIGRERR
jgi:hypothetical protein